MCLFVSLRRRRDGRMVLARRLIHHERDGRVAARGFRIGAGLVRFVHHALGLGPVEAGDLRVQGHRQTVATLVVLDQAHQRPHRGIRRRGAEFFGRVAQGTVVTGGIRARK